MSLITMCHCGHEKSTHFEQTGPCLGMHCDDCKAYADRNGPKPTKARVAVKPAPDFDDAPITHASWCTCPVCLPQAHPAGCRCSWCGTP